MQFTPLAVLAAVLVRVASGFGHGGIAYVQRHSDGKDPAADQCLQPLTLRRDVADDSL
jgi:hypothetical protein